MIYYETEKLTSAQSLSPLGEQVLCVVQLTVNMNASAQHSTAHRCLILQELTSQALHK